MNVTFVHTAANYCPIVSAKRHTSNVITLILHTTLIVENHPHCGKPPSLWKTTLIMENHPHYGKPPSLWKTTLIVENHPHCGKPPSLWKTTLIVENHPHCGKSRLIQTQYVRGSMEYEVREPWMKRPSKKETQNCCKQVLERTFIGGLMIGDGLTGKVTGRKWGRNPNGWLLCSLCP